MAEIEKSVAGSAIAGAGRGVDPAEPDGAASRGSAGRPAGGAGRSPVRSQSRCRFCRDKVTRVDYKDTITLEECLRHRGRIRSARRSGTCARHQRMVKRAIKQARYLALLSFTDSPQGALMRRRSF